MDSLFEWMVFGSTVVKVKAKKTIVMMELFLDIK